MQDDHNSFKMNSWWENDEKQEHADQKQDLMLMLIHSVVCFSSNSCLMWRVDFCSCRFWSLQRRRSQTPVVQWLLPGTWSPNSPRNEARSSRTCIIRSDQEPSTASLFPFFTLFSSFPVPSSRSHIRREPFNFTNGFLFPLQDDVSVRHEHRNTGGFLNRHV